MSKKRPYRVLNRATGKAEIVLAISKAQAISFIARPMFEARSASGLEVAQHTMAGGTVLDATDQDIPGQEDEEPVTGPSNNDLIDWDQHRAGGIAARAGVTE